MGRKFVRVSLGGVHDEAEIRGHRRTYVGALPGNIIQAIRRAGARDCVMMLDEIDKLGAGIQGDPSAGHARGARSRAERDLPRQLPGRALRPQRAWCSSPPPTCSTPFPARCATAWRSSPWPATRAGEKLQIARRYLVRRQLEANGLKPDQAEIDDDGPDRAIIEAYTREAGVRSLEREIGRALRHAAVKIAEGTATPCRASAPPTCTSILGPPRFENEVAMRTSVPGVATGLAWTPVGRRHPVHRGGQDARAAAG